MTKLTIKHGLQMEAGRDIVRVSAKNRGDIKRHDLVEVTHAESGKKFLAVLLGLDEEGVIKLDLDTRLKLGVRPNQIGTFSFRKAGFLDSVKWYVCATSPLTRIPALLAAWSVALGGAGLILAIVGICISLKG